MALGVQLSNYNHLPSKHLSYHRSRDKTSVRIEVLQGIVKYGGPALLSSSVTAGFLREFVNGNPPFASTTIHQGTSANNYSNH